MKKDFSNIPYDKIVRVGQRSLLYSDLFCVSWLLGRFCNYKCSYCWRHGRADKPDHRPTKLVIETLDEIKKQARERGFNSFHFSFSGGEPTLHPGYLDILKHYCRDVKNTNYQSLHMTTNLSVKLDIFKKYAEISKNIHRVSITASWHPEFAKRKPFLENLLFCISNDIQITVNMVMIPEKFNELWEDAKFFYKHGVNVTLKPQSDPTASFVVDGYTKDMLKRMREGLPQKDYTKAKLKKEGIETIRPKKKVIYGGDVTGESMDDYDVPHIMQVELKSEDGKTYYMDQAERFNAFNFNKFKNWECSSGYRSIIIREPDGSIKRSYSCHDKPLGYIGKGFKLFDKPKKCITPTCVSSADSKIPKRKKGVNFPLFPRDKTFNSNFYMKKIDYKSILNKRIAEMGAKKISDFSNKKVEKIFNEVDESFLDIDISNIVKSINVELTTRCSSKCKFCGRYTDKVKEKIDLPLDFFKKIPIEDMEQIRLEGSLGDPINYPYFLNVLREIRERRNSDTNVLIYTNGNKFNEDWWINVARLLDFNHSNKIVFGLDGFEDTHALHRRGTDFNKIVRNMKAFIKAGGNAEVSMIVFKHNEHQIEDLKKYCLKFGCKNFFTRVSKKYDDELESPEIFSQKSRAEKTKDLKARGMPILCGMMHFGSVFLTVYGLVVPCFKWHPRRKFWKNEDKETQDIFLKSLPYMDLNNFDFYETLNNEFIKHLRKNIQNMKECGDLCRALSETSVEKR